MHRVTGIGGLFFRTRNPEATAQWYKEHLGIDLVLTDYNQKPWSFERNQVSLTRLTLALALCGLGISSAPGQDAVGGIIQSRYRTFRIPFKMPAADGYAGA